MKLGFPGISSYDMFSTGRAIKSDLMAMGGNIFNLNSSLMKLTNGDDESRASLDYQIGAREVTKVSQRQIGKTVSSNRGGLGPTSTPARSANMLGNPTLRRYEGVGSNGRYNFGLDGAPAIGEYYDVYESEAHHLRFLDDTVGRDLLGYTHLENAAKERSGEALDDKLYLKSTYSVFGDLNYPFDIQDIETFKFGPKRYSPTDPYVLAPLEADFVRKTMNGHVQGFKEKFEALTNDREKYFGSLIDLWDYMGSSYYLNLLNGIAEHGLYVENYDMEPRNRAAVYNTENIPQSDYAYFLNVDTISPTKEIKGLLGKTNRMFYEGKIQSLVNRFATLDGHNEGYPDFLNTATDHVYGLSRGRNLRKLDLTNENGYPNPYCRVWTTHYQYAKYKNLIRGKWADSSKNKEEEHYTLNEKDELMRPNNGYDRLKRMTSIDPENGRPIFSPYYVNNRDDIEKDSIKRCMFSIENLAWKDIIPDSTLIKRRGDLVSKERLENIIYSKSIAGLSGKSITDVKKLVHDGLGMTLTEEQIGPNGGRIMWFPPYNLKFSENAQANWTSSDFIGRGEKIYSYVNAERGGNLSFTILVDHPSIVNEWDRGGQQGKTGGKYGQQAKDEMILRYFAGCDSLDFNPRKAYPVYETTSSTTSTTTELQSTQKTEIKRSKVEEDKDVNIPAITFYSIFYYPNDYSGADFIGDKYTSDRPKKQLPKDSQVNDPVTALNIIFEKGLRSNGKVGYELGNGADVTGMTYDGKAYFSGKDKNNHDVSWFYPVDNRVNDEVLRTSGRYKDEKDFGLNSSFYGTFWSDADFENEDLTGKDKIISYLNEGNKNLTPQTSTGASGEDLLNVAKTLVKIGDKENKYLVPAYNFYKHLKDVVTKLKATSNEDFKYEINIQGFASSHGYVSSNQILARNRAKLIESWIKTLDVFDFTGNEEKDAKDTITSNGNGQIENTNRITESDFKPKAARCAVVTFKIIPPKTIIDEVEKTEEIPYVETKRVLERKTSSDTYFDTSASNDYENQTYDNEYTYFKQINEEDDMVKRYISDKVKYFDPAFHSITPEGFNARLTFLQQCTRQGPTISASDVNGSGKYGAGNLSFGRPPFCVLRIGDFYNTKICIESVDIDYSVAGNGPTWDLNPEGIGLQPMFANVNIRFRFLGGSDLSGPIARLQNAVSYNYYANTSVYDRRADYRDKFISEEDDTAKSWNPMIIKRNENANITEHTDFYTRSPKSPENRDN